MKEDADIKIKGIEKSDFLKCENLKVLLEELELKQKKQKEFYSAYREALIKEMAENEKWAKENQIKVKLIPILVYSAFAIPAISIIIAFIAIIFYCLLK